MNDNHLNPPKISTQENEIILYQPDSTVKLEVRLENETVWLNRNQMAQLFDRDVKTIGKHIANALREELDGIPTVANFATVQTEGNRTVTRKIEYYNLDVIISVGYRVKSKRGIQFRQWANKVLKEYLLRGYRCCSKNGTNYNKVLTKAGKAIIPGQLHEAFQYSLGC